MTVHAVREDATTRVEVCDHQGTTEPLDGLTAISVCTACRKTWPTRFGKGAPTTTIVPKEAPD